MEVEEAVDVAESLVALGRLQALVLEPVSPRC